MASGDPALLVVPTSAPRHQQFSELHRELRSVLPPKKTSLQKVPEANPPKQQDLELPGTITAEKDVPDVVHPRSAHAAMAHSDILAASSGSSRPLSNPKPQSSVFDLKPTFHVALIGSLALCDFTFGAGSCQDRDFGVAQTWMVVCYSLLAVVLFGTQFLSLRRRHAFSPPQLVVALLQAGSSIASQCHRQSLRECSPSHDHGESRLVMLLGSLQLVSSLLYPTSKPTSFLLSSVSTLTLLIHQVCFLSADTSPAWENYTIFVSMAAICLWSTSSEGRPLMPELFLMRLEPCNESEPLDDHELALVSSAEELRVAFRPIFALKEDVSVVVGSTQVGTYMSHVVSTIVATTQRLSEVVHLPEPMQQIIVDALSILTRELRSTSTLQRIAETALVGSSSAVIEYVNTMLHPSAGADLVERLPERNQSATMSQSSGPVHHNDRTNTAGSECSLITEGERNSNDCSYGEVIASMVAPLMPTRRRASADSRMSAPQFNQLLVTAGLEMGSWHANLFEVFDSPNKQPVVVIGRQTTPVHSDKLGIERCRVNAFLEAIDDRYDAMNPFHNSLHGADVMNSLLYFFRLHADAIQKLDDLEKFTGLLVASAHDVGHPGKANPYHTVGQTSLARLFNDQSVLENMHCAIMFAVLQVDACNVLEGLDAASLAVFRSLAVQMILNTDLAKHVKVVSQFRQEFLECPDPASGNGEDLTLAKRREMLCFLLKCSDVGGSAKPFSLHVQWTMRICSEFYAQGDAERALGLSCSPFCDRTQASLRECQTGFFDFVTAPMFGALAEYFTSSRVQFEVLAQMERNRGFWKKFADEGINHQDMQSNVLQLQSAFLRMDQISNAGVPSKVTPGGRLKKGAFASEPGLQHPTA